MIKGNLSLREYERYKWKRNNDRIINKDSKFIQKTDTKPVYPNGVMLNLDCTNDIQKNYRWMDKNE